ncbi:lipocalin family protein [Muriicola sp.]|uniref:lipocalin family protein n=1 Tax=Muriicola sp. TaxID=2020856 RepID=UPI003C770601
MPTTLKSCARRWDSILLISILFFVVACSKEDDPSESSNNYYGDALKSVTAAELEGSWSLYEGELEGQTVAIPPTYPECGRDFFVLNAGGIFREFVYQDSNCNLLINELTWRLEQGVLTTSNSFGQSEELVILERNTQSFVFKTRIDWDEDGDLDVFIFTARRYSGNEPDQYTNTFLREEGYAAEEKILFNWQAYDGFNTFDRYEIYRTSGGCTKANAELVATFNEVDQTSFLDEDPPVTDLLCYFLKVYTDKGLLGESELRSVNTEFLRVASVQIFDPLVTGNTIELSWQAYAGYYFSHYEIRTQNFVDGSGYAYQEEVVATIDDISITTFMDTNPPYIKNPVYRILVYDIFGNVNFFNNLETVSAREAIFKRPEVFDFVDIYSVASNPNAPLAFLLGSSDNSYSLQRYNYNTKTVEASASNATIGFTNSDLQFITSPANGEELMLPIGSGVNIYDATTLNYKYSFTLNGVNTIADFAYLGNNLWVFIDADNVYTCSRDNANLTLLDQQAHFGTTGSNYPFHLIPLGNNKLVIGNDASSTSISFVVSNEGLLTQKTNPNFVVRSQFKSKTLYNAAGNYLINLLENRTYNATDFSFRSSFEAPYFTSGVSIDGSTFLGSNNDPFWPVQENSLHEKKAQLFNSSTSSLETIDTKGYPHLLFENSQGQIISVSSGVKRERLDSFSPRPDLFIEIIKE